MKVGDTLIVPDRKIKAQVQRLRHDRGRIIATVIIYGYERVYLDVTDWKQNNLGFWTL
jgi:hypothetical protein